MKPDLNVQIAWGDCDEQGIVFYPNYFYWMDSAFQALLRRADLSLRLIRSEFGVVGLPLVEAKAHFRASASYDETLAVAAEVVHWGSSSFRVGYRGFRGDSLVFEGRETRVWIIRDAGGKVRSAPISSRFRAALGAAPGAL